MNALLKFFCSGLIAISVASAEECDAEIDHYLDKTWAEFSAQAGPVRSAQAQAVASELGISLPVFVTESSQINGIAFHDRIAVTSALLTADLAVQRFVIAHEAAHIERQHLRQSLVVTEACDVGIVPLAPALAHSQEHEADADAVKLLVKNGMLDLKTLEKQFEKTAVNDSHPNFKERIKNILEML